MKIKNYEAFYELKEKIDVERERRNRLRMVHAKRDYFKRIMSGDWSVIVPEWNEDLDWEKWEEIISDANKEKEKIKGEILMSKQRVLVRLSKDYHNFEFEVSDIDPKIEDVEEIRNNAIKFSMETVGMLPGELKETKVSTPKNYTKKDYTPRQASNYKPSDKITLDMITTPFIKGKQKSIALGKINKGELSLEDLNNSTSWEHTQQMVFGK